MGLLDDAIREHLELKRRRGADPDEVARQEDEALGDLRSGEFARPDAEAPAEEELPAEPPAPAASEPEPEPPGEPWLEEGDDRIEPVAGQPAADFDPADVVRPDEEPGPDEDVLEETPDFLQETPEHDRLWFEQKPPRDFDFDN
jgi:hypothetical protein